MKIYLIIAEESIFHPTFIKELVDKLGKEIVGISTVPELTPSASRINYFKQQWNFFGPFAFFYFGIKTVWYMFLNTVSRFIFLGKFYSVKQVGRHYRIPIYNCIRVNDKSHLDYLKSIKPDIIVSSQGRIFKKELLNLPEIACINRHSALLPKYGGLWPVFWAMLKGENKIGVSVHIMSEKIDVGKILAQKEIKILKDDSLNSLYKKAFNISSEVVLEALKRLSSKRISGIRITATKGSYFSLPEEKDINAFRDKGLRIL